MFGISFFLMIICAMIDTIYYLFNLHSTFFDIICRVITDYFINFLSLFLPRHIATCVYFFASILSLALLLRLKYVLAFLDELEDRVWPPYED